MKYNKNDGSGVNELLAENDDPLDIRFDNVFKAVFTKDSPESQGALARLLSGIIGRDLSVITLYINEPPVGDTRDRQIRFDINCRAEDGSLINVEMSFFPNPFEPVRLEYHAAKLFATQGIRGKNKSFGDLKETYQITFLARETFFADSDFLHWFEYYDPERRMPLGGRSRIITLELCKADTVVEKPAGEMTAAELWAVFFQYLTDRDKRWKINEIAKFEEGIAMAGQVVMGISKDDAELFRILGEEKYELDQQNRRVEAERAARREGKEESLRETARKMKADNAPVRLIEKYTGLTEQQIEEL
ncbi:MAG: Rpn family recombination-promoting nuclease/putative transposase [Treponema sp.]|jgi:predicted transposase/invertase (TIGR01784 family)|nr:Rpn family recombination-promoting nuclease/putative transposase [Treponema sp.]